MKAKDERIELEKMINNSPDSIGNLPLDNPELKGEPAFDTDFGVLQIECEKKAKKMIKNATGLMMTDELIKANPYLKNKMQIDVMSLSGMIYQLSVNETMQKALMEEVRSGAMNPRMFEVFGQLSKTISDINRALLQTVEAIKMTYRDLKQDIREKEQDQLMLTDGASSLTKNAKGILTMGTKELIKETKRIKKESLNIDSNIEEAKEVK